MSEPLMTPLPISPGTTSNGYRIVRHIGKGGMGSAFEAVQLRLERRVCMKFIRSHRADDPVVKAFFESEAKALAKLSHPNIVTVFDFGQHESYPYIVMELVDGDSLENVLRGSVVDLAFVVNILRSVGSAVAYVHDNNIVHRDLKPSNILLTKQGVPKLADFGLAKIVRNDLGAVETGGIGTPLFVAPEVLQGKRYDHRADIYSFGIMAHYLLCGQMPEQGRFATEVNPSLPPDMDRILLKAMAPRPSDRYEMVRSFVNDLLAALEESSTGARGPHASRESIQIPSFGSSDQLGTPSALGDMPTMLDVGGGMPVTPPRGNQRPSSAPSRPDSAMPLFAGQVIRGGSNSSANVPKLDPMTDPASGVRPAPPVAEQTKKGLSPLLIAGLVGLVVVGGAVATIGLSGADDKAAAPQAPASAPPSAEVASAEPPSNTIPPTPVASATSATPEAVAATPAPPTATPAPSPVPTPEPPPFPDTPWRFDAMLDFTPRPYGFLVAGDSTLYAATFNNTMRADFQGEVFALRPEGLSERRIVTAPLPPQRGFSGIAVDEASSALFISFDSGVASSSWIARYGLNGEPSSTFGSSGQLVLQQRPLGLALLPGRLFVLVSWGTVLEIDPASGTRKAEHAVSEGSFLRDIAVAGDRLGGYGNGMLVQYSLTERRLVDQFSVIDSPTPRPTEGIGANPITGEFIVRPYGHPSLVAARDGRRLESPIRDTPLTDHSMDFAASPDGSTLFVTDILRRSIARFVRVDDAPAPTLVGGAGGAVDASQPPALSADSALQIPGWEPLTEASWTDALQSQWGIFALLHHDGSPATQRFVTQVLSSDAIGKRLLNLPRLAFAGTAEERPAKVPASTWTKAPELILLSNMGAPLARFPVTATPQEIQATLNLLEVP